ncbi:hypothetical protein O181_014320 [Austropuccinia psidii MF-1]|uniref:Uncharacterized protein n=1 Tax=Austropuccinia psidii MF-1 TaxID=1389203 RepID=A0A9Q3C0Q7_9BASI|nr:hypothetical protein [Austropuccinia psidii MF-1]
MCPSIPLCQNQQDVLENPLCNCINTCISDLKDSSRTNNDQPSDSMDLVTNFKNYLNSDTSSLTVYFPQHPAINTQSDTNSDPSDSCFNPAATDKGWCGHWTSSPEDITLDKHASHKKNISLHSHSHLD